LAISSIGRQKSVPTIFAFPAVFSSKERSPVPQATSKTTESGFSRMFFIFAETFLRQRLSKLTDKK
jgi:hypothetical protein